MLLRKAFAALSAGGACLVYEFFIDNERKSSIGGFTMSLNMLIETPEGFDYTPADLYSWMQEAGFVNMRTVALPMKSYVVGYKA